MVDGYGLHRKGNIYMVDIVLDVYFSQKLSLFLKLWRLFLNTFCIESLVSIGFSGQSGQRQSGKLIFRPVTSCQVPENYLQTWVVSRFSATFSPFVLYFYAAEFSQNLQELLFCSCFNYRNLVSFCSSFLVSFIEAMLLLSSAIYGTLIQLTGNLGAPTSC